ncbi:hypothetical protein BGW80DRAFT_1247656 [Lactifluus volemus]|nr:hypothetical protein BGW80DRAFT_1247656 [Lactifluus volemus]
MPDGSYLELISFLHPVSHYPPSSPSYDARRRHPWANKPCGWVAYAFLGAPRAAPPLSVVLNEHLQTAGSGVRYTPEVAGGRRRSDGIELKWEITIPATMADKEGGTRLPFFCGDVTPRELRVPSQPASNSKHPNGALGIAHLRVLAPSSVFSAVSAELVAIVGEAQIEKSTREHVWLLYLPGNITPKWHPRLVLCEPDMSDEAQVQFVRTHGAGLFELGVHVDEGGKKRGSITWRIFASNVDLAQLHAYDGYEYKSLYEKDEGGYDGDLWVLSFRQMTKQPTETFYYSRSDSRPMHLSSTAESLAIKLCEVLLNIPFLSIPYQHFLRFALPKSYGPDVEVRLHPYVASGLLFVSVTTLLLFFATGLYSEKIGYAHRYVPHANRALRNFTMYLNMRQAPRRSPYNPLSYLFPRPSSPSSGLTSLSRARSPSPTRLGKRSSSPVPMPSISPTTNPRGELIFSSRVDRSFREAYERYRAAFERKRDKRDRQAATRTWSGWLLQKLPWNRAPPAPDSSASTPSPSRVGSLAARTRAGARSSTGYEHDSEEVIRLKRQIAEQDNHCSTLQSQPIKTRDELEDHKSALDETTCKLRLEADRALRLEEQLQESKESLDKEKFMRQNADLAIRSAAEKGKEEEVARRELQQALESISSRETTADAIISNLRNEKVALDRRIRELEANLQQVISAATPKRRRHARSSSSSFSDIRITTLERDLGESQASVAELQTELEKAQGKLRRTEDDLFRLENGRTVFERRTTDEIKKIQEMLTIKDEEITQLRGGIDSGLAQQREEELIRRVEEEEAKVLALERLSESRDIKKVESALLKAEKQLAAEMNKFKALEERNAGLNRDVKLARDALEQSNTHAKSLDRALEDKASLVHSLQAQERALRAQVNAQQERIQSLRVVESNVSTSGHGGVDAGTGVETMEKILAAVDRLRSERDDLRRQLEFLQVESKFTIQALENKINSGVTRVDHDAVQKDESRAEISALYSQLQDATALREESLRTIDGLEQSLAETQRQLKSSLVTVLDAQQQQTDVLLKFDYMESQVIANDHIREQYRELQSNLDDTTARLSDVTKALENVESERNSFKVEIINLQGDMTLVQEELKKAEKRYSDLQNQQLSSMSSSQINRKLKEQIEELEARIARRTEQIGVHQHDIKRLETNLRLQEDRIGEMTSELEVAMAEKESMVEDCADAREARDRALKKADELEVAVVTLETQLQALEEQREIEVTTLVKVWSSALVQSRSSATRLYSAAYQANSAKADLIQRLELVSAEHNSAVVLLHKQASKCSLAQSVVSAHREEARDAVVALAVVQTANVESRRAMHYDRDRICALLSATRDELNIRFEEINSLQYQLQKIRAQGHAELRETNTSLDRLRAELEDELAKTQKDRDQLSAASDALRAQITQLQSDHAQELESLRGKLQQVAVDLQESRESHAAAEKACSELSAAKANLENRLYNVSQQQDTDGELISELQSREAAHDLRELEIQKRLDKAIEELERTAREREELEIALKQAKVDISKAKNLVEDRVSQLVVERDELQESLKSGHAAEVDQLQSRLRELQAEADSLQAQLDKAIADQRRIRATFEAEFRESVERHEALGTERDDVKAQLNALEAEFDDAEARLQTALEEKDALEVKNTNLESEIQRAFSMQRYLESQLKDSAHEAASVKAELEQVKEKFAHAERDGKAAEMQLTFQKAQHEQVTVSLKREIQLLRATPGHDERVQEKIGYMDELMRSKTQEIEENDDRFIEVSASRPHEPLSTTIVAGKKRSAPDDGDEAVPVQGFTSEGVLATGLNTATTPRRRKRPRTGFTPVRNTTSHPLTTLASEDAAQPTAVPIISDVTNSLRGKPAGDVKAKGSWLGAHKSRSTQSGNNATARTTSARPGAAVR